MTHEELLAKIDHMWNDDFDYVASCHTNALRAVMELHRPIKAHERHRAMEGSCAGCDIGDWPCPTIQAIEKELG